MRKRGQSRMDDNRAVPRESGKVAELGEVMGAVDAIVLELMGEHGLPAVEAEEMMCELRLAAMEFICTRGQGERGADLQAVRTHMRRRLAELLNHGRRREPAAAGRAGASQSWQGSEFVIEFLGQLPAAHAAVVCKRIIEGADWGAILEEIGVAAPFARYLLQRAVDMIAGGGQPADWPTSAELVLDENDFMAEARPLLAAALARHLPVAAIVFDGPHEPSVVARGGELIASNLRATDVVGWVSGGIAVIAPRADAAGARAISQRLLAQLGDISPLVWRAGWAVAPKDGRSVPALLDAAQSRVAR